MMIYIILTLLCYIIYVCDYIIFDENISENDYYNFWKKSDSAHFLNAYWWGKCNAIMRSQKPLYVGLRDKDNNILCEALLLKRRTPFNMCYYYCPRGYVMDWHNEKLLKTFTEELKKYLIKTNGIYLKIDPAIIYEDMDDEGNKIDDGKNNYALFNYLKEIGYQHKGFNKLYEGNQPRYSFRTFFKEYNNFNDIESKISKTFMRSIKRSYNYELKIELANNIDNFYELAQRVSNKDGFKLYKKAYYEEIFNEYGKNGYIKNFIAKINPHELINTFREQLKSEKNIDKINKLNKDIEYFQSLNKDEYVCASLICIY